MLHLLVKALKQSVYTTLPWDIPWYDPSHAVFMGIVYIVLSVIGAGLTVALILTVRDLLRKGAEQH